MCNRDVKELIRENSVLKEELMELRSKLEELQGRLDSQRFQNDFLRKEVRLLQEALAKPHHLKTEPEPAVAKLPKPRDCEYLENSLVNLATKNVGVLLVENSPEKPRPGKIRGYFQDLVPERLANIVTSDPMKCPNCGGRLDTNPGLRVGSTLWYECGSCGYSENR